MNSDVDQDVGALAVALRRVNHAIDRHSRRQNVLSGLTAPQTLTLAALAQCDQPPSITELGQRVAMSQATATDITLRLAHRGLLRRLRDPADGRRTVIELTPAGSQALQAASALLPPNFIARFEVLSATRRRRILGSILELAALLADDPAHPPTSPPATDPGHPSHLHESDHPCVDSTEKSVMTTAHPTATPINASTRR
ncbi:MAG: MarR family winged helix-turn-helix transcriptional regulator [Oceanococcaceae bacterium]